MKDAVHMMVATVTFLMGLTVVGIAIGFGYVIIQSETAQTQQINKLLEVNADTSFRLARVTSLYDDTTQQLTNMSKSNRHYVRKVNTQASVISTQDFHIRELRKILKRNGITITTPIPAVPKEKK